MRWGPYSSVAELRSSEVAFETWFPMVKARCENEIRKLKLAGEVGSVEGEDDLLRVSMAGRRVTKAIVTNKERTLNCIVLARRPTKCFVHERFRPSTTLEQRRPA